MTQVEFIQEIINAYIQARSVTSSYRIVRNIQRCRSHSISSVAEDIFAAYVYDLVQTKGYSIFVDCPISVRATGVKTKTYYPDIVVCENKGGECELKYLIDLKMDTGWFRDSIDQMVKDHANVVNTMKKATTLTITDSNKNKISANISNSVVRYDIVIVSALNGVKKYDQTIVAANKISPYSLVYTLTGGVHPNAANATVSKVLPYSSTTIPIFTDFDNYCNSL